ncbi:hypothetical protein C8R45DRAFT_1217531 [Mycena sanguinolenta]|nr:hypothetical protein C8R45DRAFT_1217531 [Mycena sanguinolenta]
MGTGQVEVLSFVGSSSASPSAGSPSPPTKYWTTAPTHLHPRTDDLLVDVQTLASPLSRSSSSSGSVPPSTRSMTTTMASRLAGNRRGAYDVDELGAVLHKVDGASRNVYSMGRRPRRLPRLAKVPPSSRSQWRRSMSMFSSPPLTYNPSFSTSLGYIRLPQTDAVETWNRMDRPPVGVAAGSSWRFCLARWGRHWGWRRFGILAKLAP